MTDHAADAIKKVVPENTMKTAQAAEKLVKGNIEALKESATAGNPAFVELTKAYQELAAKNVHNLTEALSSMAAIKQPGDLMALQQKLIKEGVESAVKDGQHIAKLTAAVFTAAFAPVRKQIETAERSLQH
jgi:hypothetical protein